ncbi:uncharacterized protein LOC123528769 isoform X2 [Mercenaria mercenaria]|uniref:uncharacterized protein LOC123528769 isoform X2 n=1 Tax=Mercenaria mercenaria TaxID=6596 RepID=UPI00234E3FFE|nr:uncharacterized protein LOC123528769 isoform X2 [Mercenaria mercenaria]
MASAGTGRHNRLCTILVQVGTPVSKALFEKRVIDLRPSDQSPSTWTVTQFLQTNRGKITSSKIGRNKKTIIYSMKPDVTNLENWDLYLITSMLIECCQLDSNIKLYIAQLRKLRNKLFHMSESTIDDDKYEHYLTKLKVIFEKCLSEIQDVSFSETINGMVKTLEEVTLKQNDIDNVMDKLRSMQEETNDRLSELGHGQQLTNAKLDVVLERIRLLTENKPALNTLGVPDSGVKIAIKNCSKEKESNISKVLVDNFADVIKRDPVLHKELSEISTESQQKIKEAVYTTYEMFSSTGCKILDANEGCVCLTMQWSSLMLMIKFYQDCMTGKLNESLHTLTEAVRTLDGCEDVTLTAVVDVDAFCVTADSIVTMIEEFLAAEKMVMHPKSEVDEYTNFCEGDTSEDSKGMTLRFRSDHSQNMVMLKNLFDCVDVDTAMKTLQGAVRSGFNAPDLLVTAHLIEDYSENKHESVQSAYEHQTADFNEDKDTAVALQEENAEFTRNRKQNIKLGTGYGIDNWLNEEKHSSLEKPNLVIALDIGNYASGFAALTRSDFLDDPQKVICNTNCDSSGLCTYKTRTCLLLNPDKSIADFGYHAESRFNLLRLEDEDENPENWYFFKEFKMVLYQEEAVTDDTPVVGAYGKTLSAIDVFSKTIKYLKEHAVKCLKQNGVSDSNVDTKWVITVPGICSESAKLVMKHAAEKAGIIGANLSVALESECAAIYCSQLPVHQLEIQDDSGKLKYLASPDSAFMVIDMGGRTVNIPLYKSTRIQR